jgi:hypothetical protein
MNRSLPAPMKFSSSAAGRKAVTSIIGWKLKRSCALPRKLTGAARPYALRLQMLVRKAPHVLRLAQESEDHMPENRTIARARRDARQGKAPSTQAGEFVREEMDHIRQGKHGARSTKQAIAIGLSKARRAGVKLRPPAKGRVSEKTRRSAQSAYRKGQRGEKISAKRSRARVRALRREGHSAASRAALSRQSRSVAFLRGSSARSAAARRAHITRSQRLRRR